MVAALKHFFKKRNINLNPFFLCVYVQKLWLYAEGMLLPEWKIKLALKDAQYCGAVAI